MDNQFVSWHLFHASHYGHRIDRCSNMCLFRKGIIVGEEGKVLVGIAGIILVLILVMNPTFLIGLIVYAITGIVMIGGVAICVGLMFMILKEIFK